MLASISSGKGGSVGRGNCSDLCQLWLCIQSQPACQQFLQRNFSASPLPGTGKDNHLPISDIYLSLLIFCPNTGASLLCSQRTCKLKLYSLCSRYHVLLLFLMLFGCFDVRTVWKCLLRGGGDFFALKYEGCLCQSP